VVLPTPPFELARAINIETCLHRCLQTYKPRRLKTDLKANLKASVVVVKQVSLFVLCWPELPM
jgi:hypothetical protein